MHIYMYIHIYISVKPSHTDGVTGRRPTEHEANSSKQRREREGETTEQQIQHAQSRASGKGKPRSWAARLSPPSAFALEGLPKERAGCGNTSQNPRCRNTPVGVAHKHAASRCPPSASSMEGPTKERARSSLRASKASCRDTAARRYSKATLSEVRAAPARLGH